MGGEKSPECVWRHSSPELTRTDEFRRVIERKYDVELPNYETLRQWTIENIQHFWAEVWHFTGVRCSKPFSQTIENEAILWPRPKFFVGAELNFAENLLFPTADPYGESIAVVETNELDRRCVTWNGLRDRVRICSHGLRNANIKAGERIAGFVGNNLNSLVSMLAAASIGAIWTAVSPDTGVHAVLERLQQIDPVLLFVDNAVIYNGKTYPLLRKVRDIVSQLDHLKTCIFYDNIPAARTDISDLIQSHPDKVIVWYEQFIQNVADDAHLQFEQMPADHPIYILYSSGTTGKPKCILHGAIGTLIQHKKEHDIQCSMRPGDTLFFYTTCTWMMWHWLVSALATGVTIVLYDGSPFQPLDANGAGEMALSKLIEEVHVSHFGTSAKYLSILEQKQVRPGEHADLSKLRAIYSTGSPLAPSTFSYVYESFSSDLNLASITGGTDIISLFGAPSQISPVYRGEVQVRGLGMAVEVWDENGQNITASGDSGDLVCVKPFPCQPINFWGQGGAEAYRKSYFDVFPGVWHHGDFVQINPQTGGMLMLGRSDGVLKPAGVRFGSSEIYNILLHHFPEVEDALCVGRRRSYDHDETVVLFLKMQRERILSEPMKQDIQTSIRVNLSARHVPAIIDQAPEIPVTINGKKVEIVVKQILSGTAIKTSASVANVQCLSWYQEWHQHNL